MELVIDANVFFSVLIKKGKTEELIFNDNLQLYAPEFIFVEFNKFKDKILDKTERTLFDFFSLVDILKKRIKTIPNEETEKFLLEAEEICPDRKDVDYFALALMLNCAIWSQDKAMKEKQNRVQIYSTDELVELLK